MAVQTESERLREQRLSLPDQPGVYVFRDKRGKQPPASADKEFAHEEGEIRQRTVRSFLSWRGNRSGILVYPR